MFEWKVGMVISYIYIEREKEKVKAIQEL